MKDERQRAKLLVNNIQSRVQSGARLFQSLTDGLSTAPASGHVLSTSPIPALPLIGLAVEGVSRRAMIGRSLNPKKLQRSSPESLFPKEFNFSDEDRPLSPPSSCPDDTHFLHRDELLSIQAAVLAFEEQLLEPEKRLHEIMLQLRETNAATIISPPSVKEFVKSVVKTSQANQGELHNLHERVGDLSPSKSKSYADRETQVCEQDSAAVGGSYANQVETYINYVPHLPSLTQ